MRLGVGNDGSQRAVGDVRPFAGHGGDRLGRVRQIRRPLSPRPKRRGWPLRGPVRASRDARRWEPPARRHRSGQKRIVMGQASRRDESLDRHAAASQDVDDPSQAAGGGFHQGAIQVVRSVAQGEPGKGPLQRAVHQRRAAAVEPVDAQHAVGPRRQFDGQLRQPVEAFMSHRSGETSRRRRRRRPGPFHNRNSPEECPPRRRPPRRGRPARPWR